MTMENDLVERLLAKAEFLGDAHFERNREAVVMTVDEEDVFLASLYMAEAGARIQALEAELAAALIEVSNQARLRGEAEGKLHVSELAGIVEGWQLRAERAEAEVREAWNEAQCCDDTPLGQATLAEFIAGQHKCRKSAEAELARKTEALNRQSDNMAFIINNIGMPNAWLTKFMRELDEDRAVAARSALEEKTDV